MSRDDPTVRLLHMRDFAREALELSSGKTRADIEADRVLCLALTRLVELIGEAATRVPAETRALYPRVPWKSIVGMRHRLIHGYDYIDYDVLWDAITDDLEPLINALDAALPPEEQLPPRAEPAD